MFFKTTITNFNSIRSGYKPDIITREMLRLLRDHVFEEKSVGVFVDLKNYIIKKLICNHV